MGFFNENEEDRGISAPVLYTMLAVAGILVIIVLIVLGQNSSGGKKTGVSVQKASPMPTENQKEFQFSESEKDLEAMYRNHELRSEDLDFWNLYRDEESLIVEPEATPTPEETITPSPLPSPENDQIEKNTIDYTNLKITNDQMSYYVDGEKRSWLGVELSKSSGRVDFDWLKRNGVDFVMLKIGGRGYESGVITEDTQFSEFIKAAQDAGLEVGVYFSSQAISVNEAVEEAQFVAATLQSYEVHYPVAYMVETIVNDDTRTQILDKDEKSQIAEAFLQSIHDAGYHPVLYGNPQWLLDEIHPDELLQNYDIMLNDSSSVPDYPYRFKMWKYSNDKKIAGVEFGGSYIISFVDYSGR